MPKSTAGKRGSSGRSSMNARTGLQLPIARIRSEVKKRPDVVRLGKTAPIFLTAVLEYLIAEVIELSGNCTKDRHKKTIAPRDIMMGIRNDEELNFLCNGVVFPSAGVVCNIHPNLVPVKKKKKKKKAVSMSSPTV